MDMNLVKLVEDFHSEDACREFLVDLRWPNGIACPRCGGMTISRIQKRGQFDCDACRYQFSVTAGTIFHDTKLPLWKWFIATYLMVESKKGISANQMKRTLNVSYKTAWYLCHRIRAAMGTVTYGPLTGTIEMDETYIGGKKRYKGAGEGGRGVAKGESTLASKTIVMGALARDGNLVMRVEKRANRKTAEAFIVAHIADDAPLLYTDGAAHLKMVGDEDTIHQSVDHVNDEWVRGDVHTNGIESAWSLLKRSIVGSYHQLSAKHLPAYLDEMEWRFNNRENDWLFHDTMRALLNAETLPYAELTANAG